MNNSTPVEGMPVVMICTVKEGTPPIVYSWQHYTNRDGMVVLAEAVTPLLNLTSANRTYMGWYTCTAHNEVNSQTSNGMYLDVICKQPVNKAIFFYFGETLCAANQILILPGVDH